MTRQMSLPDYIEEEVATATGEAIAASAKAHGYPITFGFWHWRWKAGQSEEVMAWIADHDLGPPLIHEFYPVVFVSLPDDGDGAFAFRMRWS
ncbi:hypothetical protein IPV08_15925 [Methylobacterium sp. SD274]|uniref:hypothetical protein n=1 Tax=Methylobacterium sp. SD274 TaxID=2782009 RepID=UPI001A9705DC|nr:hypothetical protein [Methylobacterium sp. SD274]MBO1021450.1 hypothetical protein [Methylobacterium sp. SD274]